MPMKKLTTAFILSLLTAVLALAGPAAKEASARDKQAPAKEKGPCEKERETKEKQCEKLGTGMAADACKKAAEHNEKNCKAAEEPK